MNLHMWRKALSVIPRLSKDEWDGLGGLVLIEALLELETIHHIELDL